MGPGQVEGGTPGVDGQFAAFRHAGVDGGQEAFEAAGLLAGELLELGGLFGFPEELGGAEGDLLLFGGGVDGCGPAVLLGGWFEGRAFGC